MLNKDKSMKNHESNLDYVMSWIKKMKIHESSLNRKTTFNEKVISTHPNNVIQHFFVNRQTTIWFTSDYIRSNQFFLKPSKKVYHWFIC